MKISTKGRYGIRALIDLAINVETENVTIKTISERQDISERYLEQIFSLLRKGGIIVGKKGAQGGYSLVKDKKYLTVYEILKVLEGENILVDITSSDGNEVESFINSHLWGDINKIIRDYFENITLEDLVDKYNESQQNLIYYI